MAHDSANPIDLDELEEHVSEFNKQLLASFWHFQSKGLLELIEEVRHLRQVVDEWSPIVAEYLVDRLSKPEQPS